MRRIGLTGWEIFSKLDAAKWTLNQAEEISQRVLQLLKGRSIPESNQRGKRNKNHMNPLIQLKKATPLFVIALVLACFALIVLTFVSCSSTPQAIAAGVPTFTPNSYSGCNHSVNVTFRSTPLGGLIWVQDTSTGVGFWISNGGNTAISFGTGSKSLKARHANTAHVFDSGWGFSGTYAYRCPPGPRPRPTPHPRP